MEHLILFDGNALVHRAYHAYPAALVTSDGTQVNAVYGFVRMLLRVWEDWEPTHMAVAFDTGAPTFRHQEFAGYKEGRPEMDEALVEQLPLIKEIVDVFDLPRYEINGYEADDLLGTIAYKAVASSPTVRVTIVTGDRDLLQLIKDRVGVLLPKNGFSQTKYYDEKVFTQEWGFAPTQLVDYKALRGDPSDNIPGVCGVGDKGAKKLLEQYGSVDNLYQHLGELPPALGKILAQGADNAGISKKLAQIVVDVPLQFELEGCAVHTFDRARVADLFERLEFRSLLNKIPGEGSGTGQESLF